MKCLILSVKIRKKNIISLSSAELAHDILSVKEFPYMYGMKISIL